MINDIIVIDDVISKNYRDIIEKETVYNLDMPWYYTPSITKRIDADKNIDADSDGWGHEFYNKNKGGSTSRITDLLLPLMYEATSQIQFVPKSILWARVFLTFPRIKDVLARPHNMLHVDAHDPHLVCLYYVNDSTGNTIITDATFDQYKEDVINNVSPPPKIIKSIEPKRVE